MTIMLFKQDDKFEKAIIEEKIIKINGDIGIRRYQKQRFLGKGGFAKVYEFQCAETGKSSAAKLIPKSSLSKARARLKLMNEIKIHRSLHHENVVLFEHFFEDNENIYLLLELCSNNTLGDMMKRRKRLTEIEIQNIMFQLILGLKYIHSNRVLHRDIKLGNLFLNDKMLLKIGDLGLACKLEFEGERKRTICGTPNYIAPEILEGKQGHSYEADVWSLGVLTYTLAVGKPPFEENDVKTTYKRIKMNAYSFPSHLTLSEHLKDFISKILVIDINARPSLQELLDHDFFASPFPRLLPTSALAVPPSSSFLKNYRGNGFFSPRPNLAVVNPIRKENAERTVRSPVRSPIRSPRASKKIALASAFLPIGTYPTVWVRKWVDYSSKYGLGYLLSNGNVGVYFNDSTKIISMGSSINYYHRVGPNKVEEVQNFNFNQNPKQLEKKVNLLEHFIKHLGNAKKDDEEIYVKKWVTTSYASIFRLNNNTVQVFFKDKTEIILCGLTKRVMFVDRTGETTGSEIHSIPENSELSKRLKYTKETLSNILNAPGRGENHISPRD